MDRGKNPFDGSRRRLSSSAHKSVKDYDRFDNQAAIEKAMKEFWEETPEPRQLISHWKRWSYLNDGTT